jgi:hypothetical protein
MRKSCCCFDKPSVQIVSQAPVQPIGIAWTFRDRTALTVGAHRKDPGHHFHGTMFILDRRYVRGAEESLCHGLARLNTDQT